MPQPLWKQDASAAVWARPAAFSIGFPTAADVATNTPATHPGGYWFESLESEFVAIVEAAGLVYDPTNTFQLLQAIQILLNVPVTPPPPPPPPPSVAADFTAAPTSGDTPLAVAFVDTTSGGTPTTWAWTFGDGGTSAVQDPTHSYTSAGTYSVEMIATVDGTPYPVTKTNLISVSAPPPSPVPNFTATPTTGIAPLSVAFTDTSSGGTPTAWAWTFGDGGTSTVENPTHSYVAAGTYSVSLTATMGGTAYPITKTNLIVVSAPPTPNFTATPTSGTATLSVAFTDTTTGGTPTAWAWTFGDGGTSTTHNPTHSYTAAGTYSVSMTATVGGTGYPITKSNLIVVSAPPAPGPFIDSYTTSLFSVCGLALLLSAYGTGPAINVRRSSDNTTQDIHFLSTGALDTTSLLTFCGSGNGFVTIWYDQSGHGNHIENATASLQPQIVSAGAFSGAVVFDGVDDCLVCVNNNNSPSACTLYWGGTLRSATRQIIACSDNTDTGGPTSSSAVMTVGFENVNADLQNKLFTSAYGNAVVNEGTTTGGTASIVCTSCSNLAGVGSSNRNTVYSQGSLLSSNYSTAGTIPTSATLFASKWTIGCANELSISRPAAISMKSLVIYEAYHSGTNVSNVETVLAHYL